MPDTALSDLQQLILALAYLHYLNDHRDKGTHPHLYAYEVLAVHWGFRTQDGRQLQVWERRMPTRPLLAKAHYGARYQAARVSTSKAFKRLHARGLVERDAYRDAEGHGALGLVLTTEGLAPARQAFAHYGPQWERAYLASAGRG